MDISLLHTASVADLYRSPEPALLSELRQDSDESARDGSPVKFGASDLPITWLWGTNIQNRSQECGPAFPVPDG
jgi:hypothetical protein